MDKIKKLLRQKRVLFHTADLALLWGIKNKNTLYIAISRFIKKGILFRIHKGFYSTRPIDEIDPILLGISYIHDYAYVSTEYVLSRAGVINQHSDLITLVSTKSKKFSLNDNNYIVRAMKNSFLYNRAGVEETVQGYLIASVERAVVDILYYNSKFYFDNKVRFDRKKVKLLMQELK